MLCSALYFFGSKIDKHDPASHCFHYKDNIILLYVHNVSTNHLSFSFSFSPSLSLSLYVKIIKFKFQPISTAIICGSNPTKPTGPQRQRVTAELGSFGPLNYRRSRTRSAPSHPAPILPTPAGLPIIFGLPPATITQLLSTFFPLVLYTYRLHHVPFATINPFDKKYMHKSRASLLR